MYFFPPSKPGLALARALQCIFMLFYLKKHCFYKAFLTYVVLGALYQLVGKNTLWHQKERNLSCLNTAAFCRRQKCGGNHSFFPQFGTMTDVSKCRSSCNDTSIYIHLTWIHCMHKKLHLFICLITPIYLLMCLVLAEIATNNYW